MKFADAFFLLRNSALWNWLLMLGCICAAASAPAAELLSDRPSIVFIMADDLGWADVQFHGGTVPTPHLNRLLAEGQELTQHYVAPLCTPTRTGLLSSRFWSRFGVTKPQNPRVFSADTVTLPKALQAVGYDTCLVGKWHLGSHPDDGPQHFGFEHSYGSLAGGVGPWNHRYKEGPFSETWHRGGQLLRESGHVTDLLCREAVDWIQARAADVPFFLYVPMTAVHLPVKEPEEWLARVPASIQGEVPRHYAACVMHLDDAVGQIVAAIERTGRRQRTLIVFTSDNGGSTAENHDPKYPEDDYPKGALPGSNRPLRGEKGELYEGGIRVPTVVSWPGKLTPGLMKSPVHICDWMPTLCGLAGAVNGEGLSWDGEDLWPLLTGQRQMRGKAMYWTAPEFRSRAVRQGDWKLLEKRNGAEMDYQLFDLGKDPEERTDLASSEVERVRVLRDLLEQISRGDVRKAD